MKNNKIILFIFFTIVNFQFHADDYINSIDYKMHFKAICYNTIVIVHVTKNENFKENPTHVSINDILGTVEGFPEKYSAKNDKVLKQIEKLYNTGDFENAEKLMQPIWEDEKNNPIYIFYMGRTYTRIGGLEKQCIFIFEGLLKMIENNIDPEHMIEYSPKENDTTKPKIIIDAWYIDAYWKLGLLYLSTGQYRNAIIQITKALYFTTMQLDASKMKAYELMLSRLSRAYHFLGDKEMSKYYYNQVMKINPKNEELTDIFK